MLINGQYIIIRINTINNHHVEIFLSGIFFGVILKIQTKHMIRGIVMGTNMYNLKEKINKNLDVINDIGILKLVDSILENYNKKSSKSI